jgi:hypothetical protein
MIYARLSNSLFMQWSGYQRRPDHFTTTDFPVCLGPKTTIVELKLA